MIDTHTHTHHSPDGASPMAEMAAAALNARLSGIAFTDHAEWYRGDPAYGYLDLDAYFTELAATRERFGNNLYILAGVELGNPHDFPAETESVLTHPFDLVIGSVHWLDNQPGWEAPIYQGGIPAAYQLYLGSVLEMIDAADFDVLGHLDLMRRDVWDLFGRTVPIEDFREPVQAVLCRLIETGRAMEINTSAVRKGLDEPVPGLTILRWYRELGGELLVIGSDGHMPQDIAHSFDLARELAKAAGFHRVPRYAHREVVDWIAL